jgi:phosphoserine phosphatase
MRKGKVERIAMWLDERGIARAALADATFYSDSINDLPLLEAIGTPVVVNPDSRLREEATKRGWRIVRLD